MGDLVTKVSKLETSSQKPKEEVVKETPRFKKTVLRKGDKINFPKPGNMVSCYYIGKLTDGTVFDKLQPGALTCLKFQALQTFIRNSI